MSMLKKAFFLLILLSSSFRLESMQQEFTYWGGVLPLAFEYGNWFVLLHNNSGSKGFSEGWEALIEQHNFNQDGVDNQGNFHLGNTANRALRSITQKISSLQQGYSRIDIKRNTYYLACYVDKTSYFEFSNTSFKWIPLQKFLNFLNSNDKSKISYTGRKTGKRNTFVLSGRFSTFCYQKSNEIANAILSLTGLQQQPQRYVVKSTGQSLEQEITRYSYNITRAQGESDKSWYKRCSEAKQGAPNFLKYVDDYKAELNSQLKLQYTKKNYIKSDLLVFSDSKTGKKHNVIFFYQSNEPYYTFANFYSDNRIYLPYYDSSQRKWITKDWLTAEHYFQANKLRIDTSGYANTKAASSPGQAFLMPKNQQYKSDLIGIPTDSKKNFPSLWNGPLSNAHDNKFCMHIKKIPVNLYLEDYYINYLKQMYGDYIWNVRAKRKFTWREALEYQWKTTKVAVMYHALKKKYSKDNPTVKKTLLDTRDSIIIEDSPDDDYWGIAKTTQNKTNKEDIGIIKPQNFTPGLNMLGVMLMHIRHELDPKLKLGQQQARKGQKKKVEMLKKGVKPTKEKNELSLSDFIKLFLDGWDEKIDGDINKFNFSVHFSRDRVKRLKDMGFSDVQEKKNKGQILVDHFFNDTTLNKPKWYEKLVKKYPPTKTSMLVRALTTLKKKLAELAMFLSHVKKEKRKKKYHGDFPLIQVKNGKSFLSYITSQDRYAPFEYRKLTNAQRSAILKYVSKDIVEALSQELDNKIKKSFPDQKERAELVQHYLIEDFLKQLRDSRGQSINTANTYAAINNLKPASREKVLKNKKALLEKGGGTDCFWAGSNAYAKIEGLAGIYQWD